MAKKCALSGKQYNRANKVSFSNKHHSKPQQANLQWKRFLDPESGQMVRLRVSTRAIKTIGRYGFRAAIKRLGSNPADVIPGI